ncbi:MAG: glycosyltransferase [Rhodospirillales bacterium]|nr:glycosyltransferase [Rhodospirillales bacterium]
MRLAIYIRSVESARGAERVAANLARGLAARSHHVDFLIEEEGGWLTSELRAHHPTINVINLRQFGTRPVCEGLARAAVFARHLIAAPAALLRGRGGCIRPVARLLCNDAPPIASLRRYLIEARPQAILSFLNYPNTVLLLTTALVGTDTRFVVSVRNHMSVAAANTDSRWVRSVPCLMRRLFCRADAVIAPSQGVADDVRAITGLPAERIAVVYNPVFRPEVLALADEPIDHPWLVAGNEPVVLGAGKFKPQKDFGTLLSAFARVRAARPARLIILGDGRERAGLEMMARDLGIAADVDFPGQVQNPYAFYRRASVFVLSSVWEGLPNALIEAMACGCPVVSTNCPSGPAEILDCGRYGALVPTGAVDQMANAILATLARPPERAAMIDRARKFSLDEAVSGFEAVLAGG